MLASTMQFSNTNQHTHTNQNHLEPDQAHNPPGNRFDPHGCLTCSCSRNSTTRVLPQDPTVCQPKACVSLLIAVYRNIKKMNNHSAALQRPTVATTGHPCRVTLIGVVVVCCSLERR